MRMRVMCTTMQNKRKPGCTFVTKQRQGNARFGEGNSIAAFGSPPEEVTTCSKGYISLSMSNDETRIGS